jgi:hypothetical protein
MSHFQPNMQTFRSPNDLSTRQFCFVKMGAANDEVVLCTVAGEIAVGVLMNAPAAGELAEVAMFGSGAKVKCSGVVARGAQISVTVTTGQGKAALATEQVVALALETAAAGDIIPVQLLTYKI